MKAYEQSERAHNHYKRILSAKSSVPSSAPNRRYSLTPNSYTKYMRSLKTTRPMQQYQYVNNNYKLALKLKQIYEGNGKGKRSIYESFNDEKDKNGKQGRVKGRRTLKNAGEVREHQNFIQEENKRIVGRILSIKSTVEDYIEKGNKNRSYSQLTSKSRRLAMSHDKACQQYQQFRKHLMKEAKNRKKSTNKKQKKRRNLVIASQSTQQIL